VRKGELRRKKRGGEKKLKREALTLFRKWGVDPRKGKKAFLLRGKKNV